MPDDRSGGVPPPHLLETAEGRRLVAAEEAGWRAWGPYLSERQWGTVREDYSPGGTAWDYFPHDHARSRAYRWGEDGIAGFSDAHQRWCLALALWNGHDPILKERLFGLTNEEGNHGEDVKELYYYLDGTPTHAYMRMLYKYPQAAFPYADLVAENARRRGQAQPEYELIDTGIFDARRYFDVTVEYAKAAPDDILMCVTVENRGPEAASLHVLPQLWARNTWSWTEGAPRPLLRATGGGAVEADHPEAPPLRFMPLQPAKLLFCENETNPRRLHGADVPGHFKDGINDYVVDGRHDAVSPLREGTKCAALARVDVDAGGRVVLRFRLGPAVGDTAPSEHGFDTLVESRRAEADAFYAALQRDLVDPDARAVQRQALAGMLWSKQVYRFDVRRWLAGDPTQPPPPEGRRGGRDSDWQHLDNADILSMPDTWEYPWYAAWDLAFHSITFALIDPEFAKQQLVLLTREWYMHPNGQLPAYEWAFGDVNPPVHAWAAWRVYRMDQALTGRADRAFLERVFHKLMLNFTWWVNRKDPEGRNIFQGGFLGLDNIGVFDRSAPLPTGGFINQADGTAWMAMYTLNLMRIALELATERSGLPGRRLEILRALPPHRRCHDEYRRGRHRALGRPRRVLLRRPEPAGRTARTHARALDGRAHPTLCRGGAGMRHAGALSRLHRAGAVDAVQPARPGGARLALDRTRQGQSVPAVAAAAAPHEGVAAANARPGGIPVRARDPVALQGARCGALRDRACRHALHRRLRARRVHHAGLRRQFGLARAGLDAAQLPDRGGAL
ncbi:MGH1-like glycoside hydrolase domain-containing protein [Dankookia sp. P2]|uniref:MGH1-like glycoside hydrolase domain-containing protein n=1 Tax=Dankookia sp. P2 TaxID=3423955 RepID=UPI003D6676FF